MVALWAKRGLQQSEVADRRSPARLTQIADWRRLAADGLILGAKTAPVTIVEFGDFQCPACRRFHQSVKSVMNKRPGLVQLVFVHLPLKTHPFAFQAAMGAECANAQGRFSAYADAVFSRQDLLASQPLIAFASNAGVPDLPRFERCIFESEPRTRVERGRSIADSLGFQATPTVLINGVRFPALGPEALIQIVDRLSGPGSRPTIIGPSPRAQ
jgi:protein-disulfide isomerase